MCVCVSIFIHLPSEFLLKLSCLGEEELAQATNLVTAQGLHGRHVDAAHRCSGSPRRLLSRLGARYLQPPTWSNQS